MTAAMQVPWTPEPVGHVTPPSATPAQSLASRLLQGGPPTMDFSGKFILGALAKWPAPDAATHNNTRSRVLFFPPPCGGNYACAPASRIKSICDLWPPPSCRSRTTSARAIRQRSPIPHFLAELPAPLDQEHNEFRFTLHRSSADALLLACGDAKLWLRRPASSRSNIRLATSSPHRSPPLGAPINQ